MLIYLSEEEINRCIEFANECAKNQQEIEFGQKDTKKRSNKEIARDNIIGKLAEVAFAKMLKEKYSLEIKLDFNYYPRGKWDNEDAEINNWRIDVKGTREGGEWMLIEWSKLRFRKKEDKLSHLYVMAEVGWDRKSDKPTGEVYLIGYAEINQLNHGIKGTYILKKGKQLPGKSVKLQADNFGMPFRLLKNDWDKLIKKIKTNAPPNTGSYNPSI